TSRQNPNTSAQQAAATAAEGLARSARASGAAEDMIPQLADFARTSQSARLWNELGMAYDDAKDLPAAEQAFRQAAALEPRSATFHTNLGYNLLLQNKAAAAEQELRKALELNPNSSVAHNNLGVILARRGDVSEAYQQFQLAS